MQTGVTAEMAYPSYATLVKGKHHKRQPARQLVPLSASLTLECYVSPLYPLRLSATCNTHSLTAFSRGPSRVGS